jgi:hypothetical protein
LAMARRARKKNFGAARPPSDCSASSF